MPNSFLQLNQVLHCILLGPTNKIIEDLIKAHSEMKSIVGYDCDKELSSWDLPAILSELHIVKQFYQDTIYEGNQCLQILKCITKLQTPLVLRPFESARHALDDLVRMCYKEELIIDYSDISIKLMKTLYDIGC